MKISKTFLKKAKDFSSSKSKCLFFTPAFVRAFLFKSSPNGELSYKVKKSGIYNACKVILKYKTVKLPNPDNNWTLPQDIVDKTIAKYLQAYEMLTGKSL